MNGTLIIYDDRLPIFVPEGAKCGNCGDVLSTDDAIKTKDMVMLCSKCATLDSPQASTAALTFQRIGS